MSPIASASTARAGASPIRNRRVMFASSGLGGSSAVGMPPTTSGSSAIPQIGHGTGSFSRTSGSIGHTQTTSLPGGGAAGAAAFGIPPGPWRSCEPGSAENFARHFRLQKEYRRPACSNSPPLGAFGFTSIPQTGSMAMNWIGSASNRARQRSEQKW